MIFNVLSILIIFQLKTIICRNLSPNDQPKTLNQCHGLSGVSYPHHSDCSLFIECVNGNQFIKKCGPGTAYDRRLHLCNHYDNIPECSGEFVPENDTEESHNQNDDESQNKINAVPLSIPNQSQWNTNQNWQSTNKNQPSTGFDSNHPVLPPQYESYNHGPQSNFGHNQNHPSINYKTEPSEYRPKYPSSQTQYQHIGNETPKPSKVENSSKQPMSPYPFTANNNKPQYQWDHNMNNPSFAGYSQSHSNAFVPDQSNNQLIHGTVKPIDDKHSIDQNLNNNYQFDKIHFPKN